MPNVIITPAFAHLRARAEQDKYDAIASGVQNTTNIVAQTLLTYSQMKKQEDTEKLSLLDNMLKTYGSNVGQPALEEYDKVLKRKGLPGLPKDTVTGGFLTPPQSLDSLVDKEITKDPELLKQMAIKQATGKSDLDRHLEEQKIDAQKDHYKALEDLASARLEAQKARTETGRESNLLKNKQYIAERLEKQRRLKLDQHKAAHAFGSKAEASMWNALKAYTAKGTTEEQRKVLRPALEEALRNADVSEENIPKFFEDSRGHWWNGFFSLFTRNKEAVDVFDREHAMRGVQQPEIPSEGIKEGEEIIPGFKLKKVK